MATKRTFLAQPQSARFCRRWVQEQAERSFHDTDRIRAIGLATSELVTNAIEHGTNATFSVQVLDTDRSFAIAVSSVSNLADPLAAIGAWSMSNAHQASGRGLAIVRACSDDVQVNIKLPEVTVRCSFRHEAKAP